MKVCTKCNIEKEEGEFYLIRNIRYKIGARRAVCKNCDLQYSKSYHEKRYPNDKEKMIKNAKLWKEKNKIKYQKISKKCLEKRRSELSDSYIRGYLKTDAKRKGLNPIEINITKEMIDIRKLNILIYRAKKIIRVQKNKNYE